MINLKTQREHLHLFDSPSEGNPADEQRPTDFFDVEFEDNYTFNASNLRYRLLTPNTPQRVFNLNLGTKRPELLMQEQYAHLKHTV